MNSDYAPFKPGYVVLRSRQTQKMKQIQQPQKKKNPFDFFFKLFKPKEKTDTLLIEGQKLNEQIIEFENKESQLVNLTSNLACIKTPKTSSNILNVKVQNVSEEIAIIDINKINTYESMCKYIKKSLKSYSIILEELVNQKQINYFYTFIFLNCELSKPKITLYFLKKCIDCGGNINDLQYTDIPYKQCDCGNPLCFEDNIISVINDDFIIKTSNLSDIIENICDNNDKLFDVFKSMNIHDETKALIINIFYNLKKFVPSELLDLKIQSMNITPELIKIMKTMLESAPLRSQLCQAFDNLLYLKFTSNSEKYSKHLYRDLIKISRNGFDSPTQNSDGKTNVLLLFKYFLYCGTIDFLTIFLVYFREFNLLFDIVESLNTNRVIADDFNEIVLKNLVQLLLTKKYAKEHQINQIMFEIMEVNKTIDSETKLKFYLDMVKTIYDKGYPETLIEQCFNVLLNVTDENLITGIKNGLTDHPVYTTFNKCLLRIFEEHSGYKLKLYKGNFYLLINENIMKLLENSELVNKDPEDMDSIQNYIMIKNTCLKNAKQNAIEYHASNFIEN